VPERSSHGLHANAAGFVTPPGHKQPRRRGPGAPARTKAGLVLRVGAHLLFANRGCGRRFGLDLAGGLIGQRRESPAVALIVGAGLAWTVSMISELSIPWR